MVRLALLLSGSRAQAETSGLDAQAAILADLEVTPDERRSAQQAFADCVNAGGPYDVTARIEGNEW